MRKHPKSPMREVLDKMDAATASQWEASAANVALRLIEIAEAGPASYHKWDAATHACREVLEEPESPRRLPRWFAPRVREVLGPRPFLYLDFRPWQDHTGVAKVNGVRCFITEPYLWAPWDEILHTPELDSAKHIARATGCTLAFNRIAWHDARCFRLAFVPLDPHLPIKAAIARYGCAPLHWRKSHE